MSTHVGFLRAVNTGHRRVTNADLVAAARSLGFTDVSAYQSSGNLLLRADGSDDEIARLLGAGLGELLGFDAPAVVRSASRVESIVAADPFPGERPVPGCTPQVLLLADPMEDPSIIDSFATDDDRLALVDTDIHWWPREGISTSALDVGGLERAVGMITVRTFGTIERIGKRMS